LNQDHETILKLIYSNIQLNPIEITMENSLSLKSEQWLTIGFLSDDPISEFRSMGLLGALMLLYITENEKQLVNNLFELSIQNERVRYKYIYSALLIVVYSEFSTLYSIIILGKSCSQ
jgi:hypothetical protein